MDTPYQWTKQVASHWAGTRNGTVVHRPRRITAAGQLRTQFHHVIDVAPTVLEAAGVPAPTFVRELRSREGASHALVGCSGFDRWKVLSIRAVSTPDLDRPLRDDVAKGWIG